MAAGRHGGIREELMMGKLHPCLAGRRGSEGSDPSLRLRLLSRVWEKMAHEGLVKPAWWPFSGLVTNLGLSFSQYNMFTYTHVSTSGLILSLLFYSKLKEVRE